MIERKVERLKKLMGQRIVIYGAGATTREILEHIDQKNSIVAFLDKDESKHGMNISGIPIYSPKSIVSLNFDIIVISIDNICESLKMYQAFDASLPDHIQIFDLNGSLSERNFWRRKLPPILIYQMGKVGSDTIQNSLLKQVDHPIYHLHYFENASDSGFSGFANRVKIITLVRDPIAREMSAFFHAVRTKNFSYKLETDRWIAAQSLIKIYKSQNKRKEYLSNYFLKFVNQTFDWFDTEMKRNLNFDIYSSFFSKEKGYQISSQDDFDLLAIKLEHLNDCAAEAFQNFLDIDHFSIQNRNLLKEHPYFYQLFKVCKENLHFSKPYLEELYSRKLTSFFYTKKERDGFIKNWS